MIFQPFQPILKKAYFPAFPAPVATLYKYMKHQYIEKYIIKVFLRNILMKLDIP